MFLNTTYNSSSYAYNSYGTALKQQQVNTTAKSNPDGNNNNDTSKHRDTFGTVALRLMSDREYDAFERATEHMHSGDKKNLAENVDDFTNDYLETKEVLHGKTMMDTLNDHDDSFNHLQSEYNKYGGMENVLSNAVSTLKSVIGGNNQDIINFITRYQATLSIDKLDLTV
jgi:hypothetical protein